MCKSFFNYFCPTGRIEDNDDHNQEEVLISVVDELWDKYDTDGNGELDKDETRNLIKECMNNLNKNHHRNLEQFSDEAYDKLFERIDRDGNGTIDKSEMNRLIDGLF